MFYEKNRLTQRPGKKTIELLENVPSAFVADAMKALGLTGVIMSGLFPIQKNLFLQDGKSFSGPAITMKFVPSTKAHDYTESPYLFAEIADEIQNGDVLVIDGLNAQCAFWGDNVHHTSMKKGAKMILVYGSVRDVTPIKKTNLPVFATGITMNDFSLLYDVVGYNITINCGGAQVRPGDLVVGDADGVLVIPKEKIDAVSDKILEIIEAEKLMEDWVEAGESWGDKIYPEVHKRKYAKKN
jgi:regulator of RNase E activity RraA